MYFLFLLRPCELFIIGIFFVYHSTTKNYQERVYLSKICFGMVINTYSKIFQNWTKGILLTSANDFSLVTCLYGISVYFIK